MTKKKKNKNTNNGKQNITQKTKVWATLSINEYDTFLRYLRVWISKMSEKKTQYVTWGLLFKLDGTIKIELSILVWYKTEVSSFH